MINNKYSDWLKKHGKKVMNAYSIAVANKWDIKSTKDVIKVLKLIDPENANEKYAKEFSKMLQLFDKTLQKKLGETKNTRKPKIVN